VPRGKPSPKLAITVDPDVHGQVLAAAAAQGVSVSAWMTAAARHALRRKDGLAAVEEWEARRCAPAGSSASIRMSGVVYDAAVLIAADRNDRRVWADHKAFLQEGTVPLVPAAVLAQASRSARQVQLRRFLHGCIVVPLDEASAHAAGRLLATADVVDASLVVLAAKHRARIVTGDPDDVEALIAASGARLTVVAI
jgi:hypothetical protein